MARRGGGSRDLATDPFVLTTPPLSKGFRLSLRRIEQREAPKDVTPGYISLGCDSRQLCKCSHAEFEAQG